VHARIVEFVEVLRQNGLRVALTETQEALLALEAVGVADVGLVRTALQSTLVKRQLDQPIFERAFDAYFLGHSSTELPDWVVSAGDAASEAERLLPENPSPLLRALLATNPGAALRLLRDANDRLDWQRLQTPLQTGYLARRLFSGMGGETITAELQALEAGQGQAPDPEALAAALRAARANVAALEGFARRFVEDQIRARLRPRGTLLERPFSLLSNAEVEAAESAVRKIAEKLKTRLAVKQARRTRGALHVRRTIRENLSWGGVPMRPFFRRKRPAKPDVVVLCDVSDSVRNASRLLLLFTWALQSLFGRVRSFIFVAELGEVTDHFRTLPPNEALRAALSGDTISLYANSDYGSALRQFADSHLEGITRKTSVLILGDGRTNYREANAWVLNEIRRRARRLVWLCTEDPRGWGVGDSEMLQYAKACDRVLTVMSLQDLEGVADVIV
jgi:uncharacterized protein